MPEPGRRTPRTAPAHPGAATKLVSRRPRSATDQVQVVPFRVKAVGGASLEVYVPWKPKEALPRG